MAGTCLDMLSLFVKMALLAKARSTHQQERYQANDGVPSHVWTYQAEAKLTFQLVQYPGQSTVPLGQQKNFHGFASVLRHGKSRKKGSLYEHNPARSQTL